MRRKRNYTRDITPDIKYGSVAVAKFANYVMQRGQKETAHSIIYKTFDTIEKKFKKSPSEVFDEAIKNASPMVMIRSRRVGGATYQVPREVRGDRRFALASRWIIDAARKRKGRSMAEKLAEEFMAAANNEGTAIKKKLDTHKMAEANKAFAHFTW
jgi:small subunit ribosomal protein S7